MFDRRPLIVFKTANVTPETHCAYDWKRHRVSLRIFAVFEVILIVATFPLWWGNHSFPRIPLFNRLEIPASIERFLVCILLAACATMVCSHGKLRRDAVIRGVAMAASLSLCVLNQQRIQAWHWMFVLGLGTSFLRQEYRMRLLQSVLATVYVCSSLSRMAPTAYHGMSAAILDTLIGMTHIRRDVIPGSICEVLCHASNIGELAIGLLLIWPRSRRVGILLAMLLHLTLLLALGPVGLRHHPAVLIWNLCFLCLIPVVFSDAESEPCSKGFLQQLNFLGATMVVWLFPLSGLIGIAHNWPAWQIYSPRPESWILQIHEHDVRFLAEDIRKHLTKPMPLDDWVVIKLDRWSFDETESPIYPQGRFQRRVIQQVLSTMPHDAEFRVEISEPDRWCWWKRIRRTLTSRSELDSE